MTHVYLNSFGAFLPNTPIGHKEMEDYLGLIHGQKSRHRAIVLRQNRIQTRYYALNRQGEAQFTSADMAAKAVHHAIDQSEMMLQDLSYLASSSTLGDILVPGLASHIHAALNIKPIEIANFQSVCGSSLMALKSAYLQIKAGEHRNAVATGCEFASRYFRPGFYETYMKANGLDHLPLEADFLRFTLSDGAGAVLMENRPNERQISFKMHWIDIKSYADRFTTCMLGGGTWQDRQDPKPWSHYEDLNAAVADGAFILKQDFDLLKQMIPVWVAHYLDLIDAEYFNPGEIDYLLCHYSAHSLREEAIKVLKTTGAMIDEEKWFSNLYTCGNTGTASIFVMLEEFVRTHDIKPGQKILCHVPESGRCLNGFFLLEAC